MEAGHAKQAIVLAIEKHAFRKGALGGSNHSSGWEKTLFSPHLSIRRRATVTASVGLLFNSSHSVRQVKPGLSCDRKEVTM